MSSLFVKTELYGPVAVRASLPYSQRIQTPRPSETYPMFATNAPYTETQSYAIPLGENSRLEVVVRVDMLHMWFRTEGDPSPLREDECVSEKAGIFLIKTRN